MVMQAEASAVVDQDVVPLAQPYLNGREIELVSEVIRSGRLSLGPMLTRFETMFAEFVGTKHAVAVSSGTAGLHVAAITSGWGPGDEVITSPFTFVSSANIARYTGATVTFADIDPQTLNMDPAAVEAAVTERTRGIVPVDIFGWPVDMDAMDDIARRNDLTIVQDSCEALGATYKGRMVGAGTGWPSVFAFYANKQMTTGEGGMLCTDDDSLAEQWRSLINQGRADSGQWLAHDRLGYNFRLSDVASAIGVAQVEKLPRILALRQQVAAEYSRMLADVPGVTTPLADGDGNVRSWFVYWVVLDQGIDRNDVMQQLNDRGIQCKPYLPSVHLQPMYRELGFQEGMFPVSEDISSRSLALPFFPSMSPQQQERVVGELRDVLAAG